MDSSIDSGSVLAPLRAELLAAAAVLSDRGLRVAAKWVLEMLAGVATDGGFAGPAPGAALPPGALEAAASGPGRGAPADEGTYQLARLLIDGREFARAAHALDVRHMRGGCAPPRPEVYPPRHFFLRSYALYMVRDRDQERERDREDRERRASAQVPFSSRLGAAHRAREAPCTFERAFGALRRTPIAIGASLSIARAYRYRRSDRALP